MLDFKKGSLLDASEHYLVHQVNCKTQHAAGLAATIFKAYPEANIYSAPRIPGRIYVTGRIVAIAGQIYPGKPQEPHDGRAARLEFFKLGLAALAALDPPSLALPSHIGCGLAGGSWDDYLAQINEFATLHPNLPIGIYSL